MDSTVLVAGMGLFATLLGVLLTARLQGRSDREGRILDARIRVYGDCARELYEFERASFDRAKSRTLDPRADGREEVRQETYRCEARLRSAIGQVAIVSTSEELAEELEQARVAVKKYNHANDLRALNGLEERADACIQAALRLAQLSLMKST